MGYKYTWKKKKKSNCCLLDPSIHMVQSMIATSKMTFIPDIYTIYTTPIGTTNRCPSFLRNSADCPCSIFRVPKKQQTEFNQKNY